MISDVLVIEDVLKDTARDVFEFVFVRRVHIAANVLPSFVQTPLEAGIDFAALVHGESHQIHVSVNGKGIFLHLGVS